ncbi:MAG: hypothetical protein ACRBB0_18650 [Pelagimonas sp.]|uniref:hypothetical protein n=1 Tax=Pelagimonas sp. TaxID=2073170 RepID=UPI003D6A362F
MRAIVALALGLLIMAQPALALSCLKPNPVRSYLEADASEERWGAVLGRLDFDEGRLPPTVSGGGHSDVDLHAQLVGHSLDADGFTNPFQGAITLRIVCTGSWCGRARSGGHYLMFIKREKGKHVAFANPCEAWMFENPRKKALRDVQRCYTGGYCQPDDDD